MKTATLLFTVLLLAGCTKTITQEELTQMKMGTQPRESSGILRPGNELWYKGTKDGFDYYHYYSRDGAFDTENDYRTPTAQGAKGFAYTDNHNQWRQEYNDAGVSATIVVTNSPGRTPSTHPSTIVIDGQIYQLVPTSQPVHTP